MSRIHLDIVSSAFVVLLAFQSSAEGRLLQCNPQSCYLDGGLKVVLGPFDTLNVVRVSFGEIEASGLFPNGSACLKGEQGGFCTYTYRCIAPPQSESGYLPITIVYSGGQSEVFKGVFEYLSAPEVLNISPNQNSVLPDDVDNPVVIKARGVSTKPGISVYFGDFQATRVRATLLSEWTEISCVPPPFPGGAIPLTVDVKIVNADDSEGGGKTFEYTRISPVILGFTPNSIPAWTQGYNDFSISVTNAIPGSVAVYFNNIRAGRTAVPFSQDVFTCIPPAQPPGLVDILIVNGDGGIYFRQNAIQYSGEPSSDFHPGDVNQDFRFNISEVLRVVQLYNSHGIHCDPETEDGYAPGANGDRSCPPYPTDNDPSDWQIGLSEVLEIIQYYNLHCYQPCPDAAGTYCPPD